MNGFEVTLLAFGLAMDAFAVSIVSGAVHAPFRWRQAVRMGASFGLFQALMPLIGWAGVRLFYAVVSSFDHWIAFGLLSFIGIKMILEGLRPGGEPDRSVNPFHMKTLLVLSVATSLDALAAGVSFAFLQMSVVWPVTVIGLTTAVLSCSGVWIGTRLNALSGPKIKILGGAVLVFLGVKILIDHLIV